MRIGKKTLAKHQNKTILMKNGKDAYLGFVMLTPEEDQRLQPFLNL